MIDAGCYCNFLRVRPKKTKWYWWPIVISSITLLLLAQLARAQGGPGVEGNWMGTLDTGPVKLRLALKVAKTEDGALSAKMDSLDQGAKDLLVSSIA